MQTIRLAFMQSVWRFLSKPIQSKLIMILKSLYFFFFFTLLMILAWIHFRKYLLQREIRLIVHRCIFCLSNDFACLGHITSCCFSSIQSTLGQPFLKQRRKNFMSCLSYASYTAKAAKRLYVLLDPLVAEQAMHLTLLGSLIRKVFSYPFMS